MGNDDGLEPNCVRFVPSKSRPFIKTGVCAGSFETVRIILKVAVIARVCHDLSAIQPSHSDKTQAVVCVTSPGPAVRELFLCAFRAKRRF